MTWFWSCVQRYNRGPESAEDLLQVGYVGLVAAINNFDPAVGCSLLRPRLLGLDEATLR